MFTRYAVEVGDALWVALYNHVDGNYSIEGIYEDETEKFAILKSDDNYYRLAFSISETEEITFAAEVVAVDSYTPDEEPQFAAEAVASFVESYKKKDEKEEDKEDKDDKKDDSKPEDKKEGDEDSEDDEDEEEEKKKKEKKFSYDSLEEIPEYVELQAKYSALEESYNQLKTEKEALDISISELNNFKLKIEKKEKENMIDSFYMLNDEDKADVIANIDTYSLEDIEAKLYIICVRNKVSFNLDDDNKDNKPTTFNLNGSDTSGEDEVPAWVKAALETAKK